MKYKIKQWKHNQRWYVCCHGPIKSIGNHTTRVGAKGALRAYLRERAAECYRQIFKYHDSLDILHNHKYPEECTLVGSIDRPIPMDGKPPYDPKAPGPGEA